MSKKPDGGGAFPVPFPNHGDGMSLRAYFAGNILQGLITGDPSLAWSEKTAVRLAVASADALIAELAK